MEIDSEMVIFWQEVCWEVHSGPTSARERGKQDRPEGGILTIMQSQERPQPAPQGALELDGPSEWPRFRVRGVGF